MAAEHTTEGTLAPGEAHAEGGLPQMNVDTFASQVFWLVLTFGALVLVLSRIAMPNIRGGMERRQSQIQGDLGSAEGLHRQAADSLKAYEASLAAARSRALSIADENRKRVVDDIERQKAVADASSQAAMAAAEKTIAAAREGASAHIRTTAQGAAIEIVERLIGERVSEADAADAVAARR